MSKWDSKRVKFEWDDEARNWKGAYVAADSISILRDSVKNDECTDAVYESNDKDYPFMVAGGVAYRFCYLLDTPDEKHRSAWDYESFRETFAYDAVWVRRAESDCLINLVSESGINVNGITYSWAELLSHDCWRFRCATAKKEYSMWRTKDDCKRG